MPFKKSDRPHKIVGSYKADSETKERAIKLAEQLGTNLSFEIEKFLERSVSKNNFKKS